MEVVQLNLDYVWILMATILVFFMQAGFCLLEVGLTRSKNSVNVAMKNVTDLVVSTIIFSLVGFGLMFGAGQSGMFGTSNFFYNGLGEDTWDWAFLLFQIAFAGTAATIVSGAIAERAKFLGYVIATLVIVSLIYPIFGHWAWGSLWNSEHAGWLEGIGFMDFAGSTVVHGIGAWIALAALVVIGPRIGKYNPDGSSNSFKGSSPILALFGMFLLWLGWFGFNAGSTTSGDSSIALIALNTHLAAVCGGAAVMIYGVIQYGKPKLDMVINGILGGLVAITAGVNVFSPIDSMIIGAIGGLIAIVSLELLDRKFRIDDAVGAVSVHGFAGFWGTIAVGLFGNVEMFAASSRLEQIWVQLLGASVAFAWAFGLGYILFKTIHKFKLLRVSSEEEEIGLDSLFDKAKVANQTES